MKNKKAKKILIRLANDKIKSLCQMHSQKGRTRNEVMVSGISAESGRGLSMKFWREAAAYSSRAHFFLKAVIKSCLTIFLGRF